MKRGKRILNVSTALILCGVSGFAGVSFTGAIREERVEAAETDVTKYSYSVQPVLAPFNNIIYVKTNNPDPASFRLLDKKSKYITDYSEDGKGAYVILDRLYLDVKYEKKSTYRVKGGYIFYNYNCDADGGSLTLQYKDGSGNWKDTSKSISCSAMKNSVDYIIDKYTKDKNGFFEKMDAAQAALDKLAVYPCGVYDVSKKSSTPYPFFATSPYKDRWLNTHYDIYERSENGRFLGAIYPFVLDSISFPSQMVNIAKRLNSNSTYEWDDYYHYYVKISLNGKSNTYGGAGKGDSDSFLYSSQIKKNFLFDGSADDLGLKGNLDKLQTEYLKHNEIAESNYKKFEDLLRGETFCKKIGSGKWLRVAAEGFLGGYGETYSYVACGPDVGKGTKTASEAWVDGRYINEYEELELGAKFSDHPKASIIRRNYKYTDMNGNKRQNDVVFEYNEEKGYWWAPYYYSGDWWYSSAMEIPKELILTKKQVEALKPDRNTNSIPGSGLIYNGKSYPGTPFTNKIVKSISIKKINALKKGATKKLTAVITPNDATEKRVTWKSDNTKVATVDEEGNVKAVNHGKANITATSVDGAKKASITVCVNFADVTDPKAWYYKGVYWAYDKGIATGTGGYFYPAGNCTREQAITFLWRMAGKPEPKSMKSNFSDVKDTKSYSYKAIMWGNEKGLIFGSKGKFNPKGTCTREQIVTMIWRMAGKPNPKTTTSKFKDVKNKKSYSYKAILWANENGIANGSNGKFTPAGKCKRRDIVTFIYRYKN